jgi:hypothetical protein
LTMQRSKLRETHLNLHNECRTKSQILARLRRNQQPNEVSFQLLTPPVTHAYYSHLFHALSSQVYERHAELQRHVETTHDRLQERHR